MLPPNWHTHTPRHSMLNESTQPERSQAEHHRQDVAACRVGGRLIVDIIARAGQILRLYLNTDTCAYLHIHTHRVILICVDNTNCCYCCSTSSFDYNFTALWSHFNDTKMHCIYFPLSFCSPFPFALLLLLLGGIMMSKLCKNAVESVTFDKCCNIFLDFVCPFV